MSQNAAAPQGVLKTVYLPDQVIAREAEPTFELDLPETEVAALQAQGVKPGSRLSVVDAAQDFFSCAVVAAGERITVRISVREEPRAASVFLVQGLCDDDVMDTIVRQATELGVRGFVPFVSEFSAKSDPARRPEQVERWRSLAQCSSRLAGFAQVPSVADICGFSELPDALGRFDAVVLCWEGEASRTMAAVSDILIDWGLASDADIALVVGPRGGITDAELAVIGDANEHLLTVSLGPAILRVETASVVAPALLIAGLGGSR